MVRISAWLAKQEQFVPSRSTLSSLCLLHVISTLALVSRRSKINHFAGKQAGCRGLQCFLRRVGLLWRPSQELPSSCQSWWIEGNCRNVQKCFIVLWLFKQMDTGWTPGCAGCGQWPKRRSLQIYMLFLWSNFVIISCVSALPIVGESQEYYNVTYCCFRKKRFIQKLVWERICMKLRHSGHKLLHFVIAIAEHAAYTTHTHNTTITVTKQ